MSTNRSAAEIPQDLIDFTKTSLLELMNRWRAHRQTIDDGERESMVKMGAGRMPIAQSVHRHIQAAPEVVPSFVDTAALAIDLGNSEKVSLVHGMVQQLASELADILMVSNAEAYEACLTVYAHVKLLAERESNARARSIAEDLAVHFKRGNYKRSTAPKQA